MDEQKWLVVKQSQTEPHTWWIDHDNIVIGPYVEEAAIMTASHLNALESRLEAAEAKAALSDEMRPVIDWLLDYATGFEQFQSNRGWVASAEVLAKAEEIKAIKARYDALQESSTEPTG